MCMSFYNWRGKKLNFLLVEVNFTGGLTKTSLAKLPGPCFSCGGEKQVSQMFLYFLWNLDTGEDYTSGTRIGFDWNYPGLYKYSYHRFQSSQLQILRV